MTGEEKNEMLLDTLIKVSISGAFREELSAFPPIEKLDQEYKPSPELDKRIHAIIEKSYKKSKLRRLFKSLGKAAACICIVFTISSIVLLSVSAARNAIFNAIVEWQEKYTEVKFGESTAGSDIYRPSYLPEGFSESASETFGKTVLLTYSDQAGTEISFSQWACDSGTSFIDSQGTNYTETEIAGNTAYLFKALTEEDLNTLIWQSNGMVFELTSKINSSVLKQIGESLKN